MCVVSCSSSSSSRSLFPYGFVSSVAYILYIRESYEKNLWVTLVVFHISMSQGPLMFVVSRVACCVCKVHNSRRIGASGCLFSVCRGSCWDFRGVLGEADNSSTLPLHPRRKNEPWRPGVSSLRLREIVTRRARGV